MFVAKKLELDKLTLERVTGVWQTTGSLGKLQRVLKLSLPSPWSVENFREIKGSPTMRGFDHLRVCPIAPRGGLMIFLTN